MSILTHRILLPAPKPQPQQIRGKTFIQFQIATLCVIIFALGFTLFLGSMLNHDPTIVFQLNDSMSGPSSIAEMDIQRGIVHTLYTDNSYFDKIPVWSPDGSRFAFLSNQEDGLGITVIDTHDNHRRRVTDPIIPLDSTFAWSPNGTQIAFVGTTNGSKDIFIFDIERGISRKLISSPASDEMPIWSPDGGQIAFVSNRDGDFSLYSVNIRENKIHRLTEYVISPDNGFGWSPDGHQMAFISTQNGNSDLYTINVDEGSIHQLTTDKSVVSSAVWSPDGKQIAFWLSQDSHESVYTIQADGTHMRQITPSFLPCTFDHVSLVWSKDSRQIIFGFHGYGDDSGIYRMDADGSNMTYLYPDQTHHPSIAWRF